MPGVHLTVTVVSVAQAGVRTHRIKTLSMSAVSCVSIIVQSGYEQKLPAKYLNLQP